MAASTKRKLEEPIEPPVKKTRDIDLPPSTLKKILPVITRSIYARLPTEKIKSQLELEMSKELTPGLLEQIDELIAQERRNYEVYLARVLEEEKKHKRELKFTGDIFRGKKPSVFRGGAAEKLVSLRYLASKHENVCTYFPEIVKISFSSEPGQYGITWKCETENKFVISIPPPLIDLLLGCKKRFVIIPLSLYSCSKGPGHANALVYDRELKTLERFEPHGAPVEEDWSEKFNYTQLDKEIEKFFSRLIPGLRYLTSPKFAPDLVCKLSKT